MREFIHDETGTQRLLGYEAGCAIGSITGGGCLIKLTATCLGVFASVPQEKLS